MALRNLRVACQKRQRPWTVRIIPSYYYVNSSLIPKVKVSWYTAQMSSTAGIQISIQELCQYIFRICYHLQMPNVTQIS